MLQHDLMYEEVVIVGNKSDFDKHRWQVDTQAGQEVSAAKFTSTGRGSKSQYFFYCNSQVLVNSGG